jgi:hypothetical protein
MSDQSRPYAIHSASECDRPERQAALAGREEHLAHVPLTPPPKRILDAGRRLDHPDDHVVDSRALRFYYASWGVTGYVVKLFKAALRIIVRSPESYAIIDLALLEKAYATAFRVTQKGLENPFTPD